MITVAAEIINVMNRFHEYTIFVADPDVPFRRSLYYANDWRPICALPSSTSRRAVPTSRYVSSLEGFFVKAAGL